MHDFTHRGTWHLDHLFPIAILSALLLTALHMSLALAGPTAATWYVDGATGNDSNDCQTPTTACATVAEAVTRAGAGDTVQITAGIYDANLDLQDITLVGAGMEATILDGGQRARVITGTLAVTLADLTVRNGLVTGNDKGGGIFNFGEMTLQRVRVMSNTAESSGGGIYNNNQLVLQESQVLSNTAASSGGGIFNFGHPSFTRYLTVTHSLIAGNQAMGGGGGIYNGASLYVADTTFQNNQATGAGGGGGGIATYSGSAEVFRSAFRGNRADTYYGGGVLHASGVLTLTNVTLSGNQASTGGGLASLTGAETVLESSTVAYNQSSRSSIVVYGGVYNSGSMTIHNSIVANNEGRNCLAGGTWASAGYNLSDDTYCQFTGTGDLQNADPLLAPLGDYGGSTWTHALMPGSAAVDNGDPANCPPTDQRGVARPVDGDNSGTAICDKGAFELRSSLSVADVVVDEGDSGTSSAVFTVTLAPASAQTVTVDYATQDGTATAGSDYSPVSGTLTFNPGETSQTVQVPLLDDVDEEPDEDFSLVLSNPQGGDVQDAIGQATIVDDDGLPSLSVADVSLEEGNVGSVDAMFTIILSPASGKTVTVDYTTSDGTATSGSDYSPVSGTLTFNPGETSQTVQVPVMGDVVDESDETFFLILSNPVNGLLANSQVQGTIQDDDTAQVSMGFGIQMAEGDSGDTSTMLTVTLTTPASFTVTVEYLSQSACCGPDFATPGVDYITATGTLTFTPGQILRQIPVTILGDTAFEEDENFSVRLRNPDPVSIKATSAIITILNDDGLPSLSVADVSLEEGNAGSVDAVFTVTLSPASGKTTTVDYATRDGTATASSDYSPVSGTLTFNPGETRRTIQVPVLGDAVDEPDETFTLALSNPVNGILADGQATGTIQDDDTLSIYLPLVSR